MVDTRSSFISQSRVCVFLKALPFLAGVMAMLAVRANAQDSKIDAPKPMVISPSDFRPWDARPRSNIHLLSADPVIKLANRDDMDPSVKPGDDFYRYANGNWLARSV